jgi:hypothetical protein
MEHEPACGHDLSLNFKHIVSERFYRVLKDWIVGTRGSDCGVWNCIFRYRVGLTQHHIRAYVLLELIQHCRQQTIVALALNVSNA